MNLTTVTRKSCPACEWAEERSSRTALGRLADEEELELLLAEHQRNNHQKEEQ
ncbi:hypothetical protein [Rothia sp. P4278]|uniref:hypothetical protein n=1 Tax=Rothia sp. P4278 TaxID=3402658 RepID=UPI003ADFA60D